MEEPLPKENKAWGPGGASTRAVLVENKPYRVNKQTMNGACQEPGIWEALLSRHFMAAAKRPGGCMCVVKAALLIQPA